MSRVLLLTLDQRLRFVSFLAFYIGFSHLYWNLVMDYLAQPIIMVCQVELSY